MADSSEVGKYGMVRLLKRREPSTVVASYPVDEEEVTFGRDPSCSVRLYYQWVSSIHCKLVFDASKRSAEDRTHTVLRYGAFSASLKVYRVIWSHAPSGLEAMIAAGMSVNGRVGIVRNVELKAHRGLC